MTRTGVGGEGPRGFKGLALPSEEDKDADPRGRGVRGCDGEMCEAWAGPAPSQEASWDEEVVMALEVDGEGTAATPGGTATRSKPGE